MGALKPDSKESIGSKFIYLFYNADDARTLNLHLTHLDLSIQPFYGRLTDSWCLHQ